MRSGGNAVTSGSPVGKISRPIKPSRSKDFNTAVTAAMARAVLIVRLQRAAANIHLDSSLVMQMGGVLSWPLPVRLSPRSDQWLHGSLVSVPALLVLYFAA